MSDRDRRAFPRAAAAWPATVETGEGRVVSGEVVNLSLSGMKVRSDSEAVVGSIVTVRVTLPGAAGRMEMVGTVVRRDGERRLVEEEVGEMRAVEPVLQGALPTLPLHNALQLSLGFCRRPTAVRAAKHCM